MDVRIITDLHKPSPLSKYKAATSPQKEALDPLAPAPPTVPSPGAGNHSSTFCLYGVVHSGHFAALNSHNMRPFVTGSSHVAPRLWGWVSSMWRCASVPHSLVLTDNFAAHRNPAFGVVRTVDVAMNTHARDFLWTRVFSSPGRIQLLNCDGRQRFRNNRSKTNESPE